MTDSPPRHGAIRLHDAAQPDLAAGLYRVTSSLDIERVAGGATLAGPPARATHVHVTGPRWALDDSEIVARHPPENALGAFWDRLPHVALGRRTLPWERQLPDGTPWLAVLVVAPGEGELATGTLRSLLPAAVVNALGNLGTEDPKLSVLKLNTLAIFQALLPSRADVRLLAHVRQVNVADTALASGDDDGSFAVVTANRLPLLAAGAQTTAYLACLVSLEGRADVWNVAAGATPPPLIVLASWTFTVSAAGGTFEELARRLHAAPFGTPPQGAAPLLDAAGAIPVERVDRTGQRSVAQYRGPLLGTHGAQALEADSESGLSVSAALELGRLLGAADGRFLRELVAWHRADEAAARANSVRASVEESLGNTFGGARRGVRGTAAAPLLGNQAVREVLSTQLVQGAGVRADLWQVHPAAHALAARAATKPASPPRRKPQTKRKPASRGSPKAKPSSVSKQTQQGGGTRARKRRSKRAR